MDTDNSAMIPYEYVDRNCYKSSTKEEEQEWEQNLEAWLKEEKERASKMTLAEILLEI